MAPIDNVPHTSPISLHMQTKILTEKVRVSNKDNPAGGNCLNIYRSFTLTNMEKKWMYKALVDDENYVI